MISKAKTKQRFLFTRLQTVQVEGGDKVHITLEQNQRHNQAASVNHIPRPPRRGKVLVSATAAPLPPHLPPLSIIDSIFASASLCHMNNFDDVIRLQLHNLAELPELHLQLSPLPLSPPPSQRPPISPTPFPLLQLPPPVSTPWPSSAPPLFLLFLYRRLLHLLLLFLYITVLLHYLLLLLFSLHYYLCQLLDLLLLYSFLYLLLLLCSFYPYP